MTQKIVNKGMCWHKHGKHANRAVLMQVRRDEMERAERRRRQRGAGYASVRELLARESR